MPQRQVIKEYLAASHVAVLPDGREHTLDRMLEAHGHHRRMQNDPANTWLRGLFHAVNRRD